MGAGEFQAYRRPEGLQSSMGVPSFEQQAAQVIVDFPADGTPGGQVLQFFQGGLPLPSCQELLGLGIGPILLGAVGGWEGVARVGPGSGGGGAGAAPGYFAAVLPVRLGNAGPGAKAGCPVRSSASPPGIGGDAGRTQGGESGWHRLQVRFGCRSVVVEVPVFGHFQGCHPLPGRAVIRFSSAMVSGAVPVCAGRAGGQPWPGGPWRSCAGCPGASRPRWRAGLRRPGGSA